MSADVITLDTPWMAARHARLETLADAHDNLMAAAELLEKAATVDRVSDQFADDLSRLSAAFLSSIQDAMSK